MTDAKLQALWISITFGVVLVLDQLSKFFVRALIEPSPAPRPGVFFHFTHQENTGLVGGVFRGAPFIAIVAPLLAFGVLVYLYRHLDRTSRWQSVAYGLVLGGAVGNIADRIVHGGVTDFLQFHFYFIPFDFPWKYYPAFNLADSAIFLGVGLLIVTLNAGARDDAARTA